MEENTLEFMAGGLIIRGRPSAEQSARLAANGTISGLFFEPDGFQGWDSGGEDTRRQATERPVTHGEYDVPVYLGARVVTCTGMALATTETDLRELRDRVSGVGANGVRLRVSVTHQGRTLWAWGRRTRATFTDLGIRSNGILRGAFELQFLFANPRKFGELQSFGPGSSFTVYHRGNVTADPVITVPAASSSYSITGPNGTRVISGAPSGQTHVHDMATGRFTSDGTRVLGAASGQLLNIGAGARPTYSISSGQMQLEVHDTFV